MPITFDHLNFDQFSTMTFVVVEDDADDTVFAKICDSDAVADPNDGRIVKNAVNCETGELMFFDAGIYIEPEENGNGCGGCEF